MLLSRLRLATYVVTFLCVSQNTRPPDNFPVPHPPNLPPLGGEKKEEKEGKGAEV